MNPVFNSSFSHCPVIWMFYNRHLSNQLDRLHEHCLRLVCNIKRFPFEELLDKDSSVSIHHKNIQMLATEMYKVKNGSSPEIMNEIFQLKEDNH